MGLRTLFTVYSRVKSIQRDAVGIRRHIAGGKDRETILGAHGGVGDADRGLVAAGIEEFPAILDLGVRPVRVSRCAVGDSARGG